MSPKLPLLAERRSALETCGYCPKLCRAACPVSEAEASETLTPWGKMSLSWFASRGDVPVEPSTARVAWACTGCLGCRERCDHRNPVAETLYDARADFAAANVAPAAAKKAVEGQPARVREVSEGLASLRSLAGVEDDAPTALLLGCDYVRRHRSVAEDAVRAAVGLAGPVRLVDGCCGAPLRYSGDRDGYLASVGRLDAEIGSRRLVVVDPGCAMALADRDPALLVDLAARDLGALGPVDGLEREGPVRWHDPCQLGRGLGRYDGPRAVLSRALRHRPAEFERCREHAVCSGAGGLLPLTMPETSEAIARRRVQDHQAAGGGTIVTACAGSIRRFESVGAKVLDLSTIIRRALDSNG